jgi:dCTP diphosphatase
MPDGIVPLKTLKELVFQFVHEREWEKFHTPKNLTAAIAIEAAELMEVFQWATTEESKTLVTQSEARARVEEELADVIIYCLALANQMDLDLTEAVCRKVELNARKYPSDLYRGRY